MARSVYLLIYNSPLFPAHWAIWIPSEAKSTTGKLIHARGDARSGFDVTVDRNYDISQTGRKHEIIPLARVDDSNVVDSPSDAPRTRETGSAGTFSPQDKVEQIALRVPAPGPSLRTASDVRHLLQAPTAL
ncbi:hypothetical protein V8F06_004760 [Rhypophila decipiens]